MKYLLFLCSLLTFLYTCFWLYQAINFVLDKSHTIYLFKKGVHYQFYKEGRNKPILIIMFIIFSVGVYNGVVNYIGTYFLLLDACTVFMLYVALYIVYRLIKDIDYRYNFRRDDKKPHISLSDSIMQILNADGLKQFAFIIVITMGIYNLKENGIIFFRM